MTDSHSLDELYMSRALELAQLGQGKVSPNPMVGCVIVHDNRVIGEGWHQKYGGWHAEVNAIQSVANEERLPESTVYVTLEPCSHFGKTPPCADLLISKKVKRVVVAALDTNPLVGGQGIARLRAAGIAVETGVLEKEARWQNRRFFTFMEKKRPYLVLKWAQTADGFIARTDYNSRWISGELSRRLVHKWRGEEAAIMVGTNTAHHDNPRLNVRSWSGDDPIRIVVDRNLRLSHSLHLFDQTQTTLCYNLQKDESDNYVQYIKCENGASLVPEIMADLYRRKIQSVLIEGGTRLLQECVDLEVWDEARIFTSVQSFNQGIRAPGFGGKLIEKQQIQEDELQVFVPSAANEGM